MNSEELIEENNILNDQINLYMLKIDQNKKKLRNNYRILRDICVHEWKIDRYNCDHKTLYICSKCSLTR